MYMYIWLAGVVIDGLGKVFDTLTFLGVELERSCLVYNFMNFFINDFTLSENRYNLVCEDFGFETML